MRTVDDISEIHHRLGISDPAGASSGGGSVSGFGLYASQPRGHRPIVAADAMMLISDATRGASGKTTLMSFLAQQGLIRLVTADHIDAKVYANLPKACSKGDPQLRAATAYYEAECRPWLRAVNAGGLAVDDERVLRVRRADAEDVALAQIGVALAPSLLFTWD